MRIKKYSNGNQYLMCGNMWVRNFLKKTVPYIDINQTITESDYFTFLNNEVQNNLKKYTWIDSEKVVCPKILIVSDGLDFQKKHKIIENLPKDITIIGVNGVLKKWEINSRNINYYVVNNPYKECMKYLPRSRKMLPKCIASARTNYEFLENYNGTKYKYYPVGEKNYSTLGNKESSWQVDDYRNSICAALVLSYYFEAEKIMMLCCDDTFTEERPGAIQLENGYWMYPQQNITHDLIDGICYWFKQMPYQEVSIVDCSSGPIYKNATYIKEEDIVSFWSEK
jgi:hypothetical protein